MNNIVEAAEEFIEKMTDAQNAPTEEDGMEGETNDGDRKVTLEERKAKMEQLRLKMVRVEAPRQVSTV